VQDSDNYVITATSGKQINLFEISGEHRNYVRGGFNKFSYGLFLLGGRFDTYEPFISLIFNFFSSHCEPRIIETTDTTLLDTGAHLYFNFHHAFYMFQA
jgi:hypothetical protein